MQCQSKLQLLPNGPALVVPGEWQCQETSILGGRSTLLPCKGLQCYTAQTETFEESFLAREAICAWHGAVQATSLFSSPTKRLTESETTGWFSGVKSVSWCAFGGFSWFFWQSCRSAFNSKLFGGDGEMCPEVAVSCTKSTCYGQQSLWFTCCVFQNITGGAVFKDSFEMHFKNWNRSIHNERGLLTLVTMQWLKLRLLPGISLCKTLPHWAPLSSSDYPLLHEGWIPLATLPDVYFWLRL